MAGESNLKDFLSRPAGWLVGGLGLLVVGAVAFAFSGIGLSHPPTAEEMNGTARLNAEQSVADVLVPIDERFRETWDFHVLDSPDNYTYSANANSVEGVVPDRKLMAYGYLVNDVDNWSGGSVHGVRDIGLELHESALRDSADPDSSDKCRWWDAELRIVRCDYGGPPVSFDPTITAVRRFDEIGTVMIAATSNKASLEYLFGEFEIVPIEEAREKWLVDAR